jgi:carboxypeptidase Taq
MASALDDLKTRLAELSDLGRIGAILAWDQQTMMPPLGSASRAEQRSTLGRIFHERFTSDEVGRLIEAAEANGAPEGSDDAELVRYARREWEKARRIPTDLRAEITRASAMGVPAWMKAREASDFSLLVPALEHNLELRRRYIECFDGFDEPYDVLLDDFEEGMTTARVRDVLGRLRDRLVPLIAAIAERADEVDASLLHRHYPAAGQRAFVERMLGGVGFDRQAWRLDLTAHPFAVRPGVGDVRITTRWEEGDLASGLFAALHECGHGLYDSGVDPALDRSPLGRVQASMALHESQSRLWENVIGRSRPFWRHWFGPLRETFPEQLADTDAEGFYRAVNRVEPSLIRVEADEATYSLHIALRFELEQELLAERLAIADLPEAWNAGMREYLGVEVPDDARGVLQDIHWASGSFGYFPTYALGNVVAGQIWARLRAAVPDLDAQLAEGDAGPLRSWLEDNLYRHGRRRPPQETIERVCGGPMDPAPFVDYLTDKLGEIYGLERPLAAAAERP